MKFSKIIGKSTNPKIKEVIREAEDKLSSIFTELSMNYTNTSMGCHLGGSPLTLQLVYTIPHICDISAIQYDELVAKSKEEDEELKKKVENDEDIDPSKETENDKHLKHFLRHMGQRVLRTAATSGSKFFWNPEFVNKLSRIGLRIVVEHEAGHAIFMHPNRRGAKMARLWNIAVDFKVNYSIIADFKARGQNDSPKVFTDNLGEFISLQEYADFLKNPFEPPPRLAHLNPMESMKAMADPAYGKANEEHKPMYFADADLSQTMKMPENIYEHLLNQVPKCKKCGKLGMYKKPEEYKALEKKIKEQEKEKTKKDKEAQEKRDKKKKASAKKEEKEDHGHQEHDHKSCSHSSHNPMEEKDPFKSPPNEGEGTEGPGEGETENEAGDKSCGSGESSCGDGKEKGSCDEHSCDECGGENSQYVDPFAQGDLLDEHIESDISEDEMARRLSDAAEMTRRMGGTVPGYIEDEIGQLLAPKLRWQDFIRMTMKRKSEGYGRNNWLSPKRKPLFAGCWIPKKQNIHLNILVAYDCSGSMSQDDIAFGISQLQVIDERSEMSLVAFDTVCAWDQMVKIKKANKENLSKIKALGRGGTLVNAVFNEYRQHCDPIDMIVIISDCFLADQELKSIIMPEKNVQTLWLCTSRNNEFKPPFGRLMRLLND